MKAKISSLAAKVTLALASALTALFATSASIAAEYRIAVGDVLELSAASVPEFKHRAAVGVDGEISFPLVGDIPAAGKSVAQLRKDVRELIPKKSIRRRALDGSEHEVVIDADEISLLIVEYGPVYVNGDVSKPGAYPYRPGMTVRQAISLAGGFDVVRSRTENPFLLVPDVRSSLDTLAAELARDQARVSRLQAELGRPAGSVDAPSLSPVAGQVRALEAEQLSARLADVEKERAHIAEVIRSLRSRLTLLQGQIQTERDRARIDQEELERIQGLFDKGLVPITRLTDVKRLILLSASRASDIESRAEQTKTELEVAERRLQRLDDERRIELLKELQEAQMQVATTRSRIDAATEKMFYLGALRSKIGRTTTGSADLTIIRKAGSRAETMVATEETELLPSDVVEVALRLDLGGNRPAPPTTDRTSSLPRERDGLAAGLPSTSRLVPDTPRPAASDRAPPSATPDQRSAEPQHGPRDTRPPDSRHSTTQVPQSARARPAAR